MTDLLTATMTKPEKLKYVDKTHAYYLDGKRAKSVTTVAKIPEDGYALELWAKRMVAIGIASAPHLVEAVAAHFDDRKKLNEIVEEAETLAKTNAAAIRGTAMHRVTERADRGEAMLLTSLLADTVKAWRDALDAAGYESLPEYVERVVVYPEQMVCGTLDRIVRRKRDGLLRVLDLKSGEKALKYPHSIAIQIALYAHAPWMAAAWEGESGETTEFEPLPDGLDRDRGLILHMPEPGNVQIAEVDIAAGWDIASRSVFPILDWRDRDNLLTVVELDLPKRDDDPFTSFAHDRSTDGEPVRDKTSPREAPPAPPAGTLPRVEWIAQRVAALPESAVKLLQTQWPAQFVKPPKAKRDQGRDYGDEEIAYIDAVLVPIERDHEAPFSPDPLRPEPSGWVSRDVEAARNGGAGASSDPTEGTPLSPLDGSGSVGRGEAPALVRDEFVIPDEGPTIPDEDVDAMQRSFDALVGETKRQARAWLGEMAASGNPIGLPVHRTRRRWSIAAAVRVLASYDDEIARACLAVVTGDDLQESITTGAYLASLTIDEADRLADMGRALDAGNLRVAYGDDGACEVVAA